jgi:CubicO group peptidase (beta-lactamase class C family)
MNKVLSLLLITTVLASCNQNQTAGKTNEISDASFDSNYQPATFADAGRMEKIMQAFPVIDKIFKDYADSNHLPGVAYGLVVDGKLVYKGNIGYTDIEKKIPVTSSSLFRYCKYEQKFCSDGNFKIA